MDVFDLLLENYIIKNLTQPKRTILQVKKRKLCLLFQIGNIQCLISNVKVMINSNNRMQSQRYETLATSTQVK